MTAQQKAIQKATIDLANAAEKMHLGITQGYDAIAKLGATEAEDAMRRLREATR